MSIHFVTYRVSIHCQHALTKEGLIHPTDSARAVDFHKQIQRELSDNLLKKAKIRASSTREARGREQGTKGNDMPGFQTKNLTDDDFDNPTRSVELPALPDNVANAIGTNGKPVIIKKNIFG